MLKRRLGVSWRVRVACIVVSERVEEQWRGGESNACIGDVLLLQVVVVGRRMVTRSGKVEVVHLRFHHSHFPNTKYSTSSCSSSRALLLRSMILNGFRQRPCTDVLLTCFSSAYTQQQTRLPSYNRRRKRVC